MVKKMSRIVAYAVMMSFVFTFIISPTVLFADESKTRGSVEIYKNRSSMVKTYSATREQVDQLKKSTDLKYVEELPGDYNAFFIKIDPKLGGGYLIGDADKIAALLNQSGITVGLTSSALAGGGEGAFGVVIGLAILAIILAASSNGGGNGGGGGGGVTPTPATH